MGTQRTQGIRVSAGGWGALALLLLLLMGAGARAQSRLNNVSIDRFTPALDAEGFIGVQGTRTPGSERYTLSLSSDYASNLLQVELPQGQRALVAHRVQSQLAAQVGIGARFAAAVSAPLVWYQAGDRLSAMEDEPRAPAMGDPSVLLRYRFLGDAGEGVSDRRDGPGVALQATAILPLGDVNAYVGEGATRLRGELLADFHVLGAGVGASVGFLHRFHARPLFDLELRDELTFGAGLKMPIPVLHPLIGLLELRGVADFEQPVILEGLIGARAHVDDVTVGLSGGAGLTGGMGNPGARVVLSLSYAPEDADADGDGVPDEFDECPPLPEDPDGFEDHDGCPDPDNDNDLVPDVDDLCPNEEALEDRDDDEDGCTDP